MPEIKPTLEELIEEFRLAPSTVIAIFCAECNKVLYAANLDDTVTYEVAELTTSGHAQMRGHQAGKYEPTNKELLTSNMDPGDKIAMMSLFMDELSGGPTPQS